MTNLEAFLCRSDVQVSYPDDIDRLKGSIRDLRSLPDAVVEELYAKWSDLHSAGWLMLDGATIESFRCWLDTEAD